MDSIREKLKTLKESGMASQEYTQASQRRADVGYFLAGILDGDASFGLKKRGDHQQPFLAIAMKDEKIIQLLRDFIGHGNVRKRRDGVYHYEVNHNQVLQNACKLFLTDYPLRHARQRERMQHLQKRILNDYTRNRHTNTIGVGE